MNRRLVAAVGVLCAVGITVGAASTAFAGTGSTSAESHSTGTTSSGSAQASTKPIVTVGKATTLSTAQQGSISTQSSVQGTAYNNTTSSTQSSSTEGKAQLKSTIQSLHAAIKADQSARKQLIQAFQNFRHALQQAMANGNASAVKTAIEQAQGLRATVSQAMSDRQSDGSHKVSVEDQQSGHLSMAVSAINAVITRDDQEASAMLKAAQELNNLAATLTGTSTTSSTGSGSPNADANLLSEFGHLPDSQVHSGGMEGSVTMAAGSHQD